MNERAVLEFFFKYDGSRKSRSELSPRKRYLLNSDRGHVCVAREAVSWISNYREAVDMPPFRAARRIEALTHSPHYSEYRSPRVYT